MASAAAQTWLVFVCVQKSYHWINIFDTHASIMYPAQMEEKF